MPVGAASRFRRSAPPAVPSGSPDTEPRTARARRSAAAARQSGPPADRCAPEPWRASTRKRRGPRAPEMGNGGGTQLALTAQGRRRAGTTQRLHTLIHACIHACYCDHQENRKSVVGCDHLRCTRKGYHCQPFGLKTFSGLSTSRWADGNAGRDRTHVVLVPTFPILRAGESHNRKEKVSKLLETSDPGYPL